jgi:uncharacterized protein with gpF-like domain
MARRLIDQDARREQRRQSAILDRLEVGFRARIRAEIARAMDDMARVFELTGEVPPARDHYASIEAIFRAMAIAAATTFGARVAGQGKQGATVLETKDFAETMTRLALSYIAGEAIRRRIASIADTTRNQIVQAVARGYAEGLAQDGVADMIRAAIPSMSSYRAEVIARTETHGAANFGAMEAARETGIDLRREWVSAEDERTRDSHVAANGQIVGMDEPFAVGDALLMYPGDPDGPAAEVISCRCAVAFIVDD